MSLPLTIDNISLIHLLSPQYQIKCAIRFDGFMKWTKGELRPIQYRSLRRRPGQERAPSSYSVAQVPAPYNRIVSQLITESLHMERDPSHESYRRGTYADKVLDAFARELAQFKRTRKPPASFRSKVLTPILQRQLLGVDDSYTPSVQAGINKSNELSIHDVTRFYLGADPVDPTLIWNYRRNLLYLPDPRWHLGTLMQGGFKDDDEAAIIHYNKVRTNHDAIMKSLKAQGHKEFDSSGSPLLSTAEVTAIIDEDLEAFFQKELKQVVSRIPFTCKLIADNLISTLQQPHLVASVKQTLQSQSRKTKISEE